MKKLQRSMGGTLRLKNTQYYVFLVLKLAAVAAVVTAIVSAVVVERPGPGADVVMRKAAANLRSVTGVVCRIDTDLRGRPDAVFYEDLVRGQRQDHIKGKRLVSRTITDFKTNTQCFLDFARRVYCEIPLSQNERKALSAETHPLQLAQSFFERENVIRLGKKRVDGAECYGFEVTYTPREDEMRGTGIVTDRIWVGVGNFWPVRFESIITGATNTPKPDWQMWIGDFRWNPQLADSVFTARVPEGFRVVSWREYREVLPADNTVAAPTSG